MAAARLVAAHAPWRWLVAASVGSTVLMTVHVLDPFWFEHLPAFVGAVVPLALRERAGPARVAHASADRW
jgi:hypothetical protein